MSRASKKILALTIVLVMLICSVGAVGLPRFTVYPVTDGGGYIMLLKSQYEVGEKVIARAVPNEGYAFYAWSCEDIVFNENQGNDMIEFIMPAKDIALGAVFAIKQPEKQETLSVTFDSMGGTDFGTKYVFPGNPVEEPSNVPVKQGHIFDGWYSDSVCTMPYDFSTPIYSSTFIYAKWAPVANEPIVENGFKDVKTGDWYYESVMALSDRNVISGMGNSTFAPKNNITRAQFATILANLANANLAETETPFGDVAENEWYATAVAWAYTNGVVNGMSEGRFAPDANITRQDMAVMIMRYVNNVAQITLPEQNVQAEFADNAKIASYSKDAVYTMQMAGIIGGKPGNVFDPMAYATRAEASKMIHVLLNIIEK